VRLNRPEKHNAIDGSMMDGFGGIEQVAKYAAQPRKDAEPSK
jgi:enoyl-CoA hydratase/carnithine racemase